jgi:hypothetical protein
MRSGGGEKVLRQAAPWNRTPSGSWIATTDFRGNPLGALVAMGMGR